MKIVIDSNRVIAALIIEGTTREILFDKYFEFFAPEHIKTEIEKYKEEIMQKSSLSEEDLDILLSLIFEHISIISSHEYISLIESLKNKISDERDLSYLTVCLLIKAEGIWTHDPHFKEQDEFKIYTNIDLLDILREDNEEYTEAH